MPESPEEFDTLMKKVRLGDRKALARLLRCYENEVHQAARCMLGRALRSYLDPADLVQSVHRTLLLGLQQNRFEISSPRKLVALAVTLARNKAARAARRVQCQQRHTAALAETAAADAAGTTGTTARGDPARIAEYNDIVDSVCSHLDDTDRRLVQLRLQGHSTAEAARVLGLNADVLRVRLSRLRQHLRSCDRLLEWI
jgi:RNA polymerase sigma-70 factor (ECF subfamily)